jgi:hypothetical protein
LKWERFVDEPWTADDWWNIQVSSNLISGKLDLHINNTSTIVGIT